MIEVLLALFVTLLLLGMICYIIDRFVAIDPFFKNCLYVIVIIILFLILFYLVGPLVLHIRPLVRP